MRSIAHKNSVPSHLSFFSKRSDCFSIVICSLFKSKRSHSNAGTGNIATSIVEIEELIELKLQEMYIQRNRIERFINDIDDAELRLIIRLRSINNMKFREIGREVNMDSSTVFRKYKSFVSKLQKKQQDM